MNTVYRTYQSIFKIFILMLGIMLLSVRLAPHQLSLLTDYFLQQFCENNPLTLLSLIKHDTWYNREHNFLMLYRHLFGLEHRTDILSQDIIGTCLDDIGDEAQSFTSESIDGLPVFQGPLGEWYLEQILVSPSTTIHVIGDIYGDLHAILRALWVLAFQGCLNDNLTVIGDRIIVFSGNYVGRHPYGLEIWYLLLRLKKNNPGKVFILKSRTELSALQQQRFFGEDRTFHLDLGMERYKAETFAGEPTLVELIIDHSRSLPVGLFCTVRDPSPSSSRGAFISPGGVPLISKDANFSYTFYRKGWQRICPISEEQAQACMNQQLFCDQEEQENAHRWIQHVHDHADTRLASVVIVGGAYLTKRSHRIFRQSESSVASMIVSKRPGTPHPHQTFFFHEEHDEHLAILQASNTIPFDDDRDYKIESLVTWCPWKKAVVVDEKRLLGITGHGSFVSVGSDDKPNFIYRQGGQPHEKPVPDLLARMIGARRMKRQDNGPSIDDVYDETEEFSLKTPIEHINSSDK